MSSLLTHVTVLFTGTVRVAGPKVKLSNLISVGCASSLYERVGVRSITNATAIGAARTRPAAYNFFIRYLHSFLYLYSRELEGYGVKTDFHPSDESVIPSACRPGA